MNEFNTTDIIDNLIQVMTIAAQYSSNNHSGVEDLDGSLRYCSGCEFPFFNGVFNNHRNSKLVIKDELEPIIDFFTDKKLPFIWWWTQQSEIPEEIKLNLDENGFQFLGDFLGIAAKLDEMEFSSTNNKIEIGIVSTHKEYELFLNIMCHVFQMSEFIKNDLKEMYQSYGPQGKFKHYIGYYLGEPVSTLTTYMDGQIVGLYNGATLADFQKNGICSALAHHAIKEAMALNCKYAVSQLMTPGMAKGLSDKMGAKTYCILRPYLKDPRMK